MNKLLTLLCFITAAGMLGGCATSRIIDSEVQTFSTLQTVPDAATFRFDRLPSQQAQAAQHARLEAIAAQALGRVGFKQDGGAARFAVQIGARTDRDSPEFNPLYGPGWPERSRIITGSGRVIWAPYMRYPPPPSVYRREVSLVMRETASNQIVYETHAAHHGGWSEDNVTLAAMFEAALRDFPNPLAGPRRIEVEIAR